FWTDHEPARKRRVVLPSRLWESQGPPVFRNRGWFINDEDLLTGWKPGAKDGTGIALSVWDKVFEALLRLKGNMIVPGTFIFPDEPQVRAATERGLIIAQHHIEVLGTNTYRWPDDKPYSFVRFPQLLEAAWEKAVETYLPNQEVLWTVGYRGRHDRPFWEDDRFAGASDRDKGRVIDEAIAAEMKIVRRDRSQPEFIMNAWDEAVGLLKEGDLQVPPGVSLVWPDDGHGTIRDGGAMAKKQGLYYHTAMHDFMANQLTEMVPPAHIEEELTRAVRAGATEYLLDNTSDLRPVPMTTREVMELAWSGGKAPVNSIARWCREEFGGEAAPRLTQYYKAYFAAPARYGIKDEKTMGENAYHTLARYLLVNMISGKKDLPVQFQYAGNYERFASALQQSAQQAAPRWARARVLAKGVTPLVPSDRRDFFRYHVMSQLDIQEHSNRMLEETAAAWLGDREQRRRHLEKAVTEIQSVLRAFDAGEYGKWKGFYDKELFTNVRLTLALTHVALDRLAGKAAPENVPIQARTPDPYPILKSYQGHRRVSL
ncbi:MAG: glycosyl hydrolase 115 family protein, partial [Bryobacteraceae bacterium]